MNVFCILYIYISFFFTLLSYRLSSNAMKEPNHTMILKYVPNFKVLIVDISSKHKTFEIVTNVF